MASTERDPESLLIGSAYLKAVGRMSSGFSNVTPCGDGIGVGLRIALGVAWTAIIAAELAVGAKAGGGGSGGVGQMMFVFYAYSIELNRIIHTVEGNLLLLLR